MILVNQGIDAELVKSNLIVTLNEYEITSRTTEIAVVNEDDISKYLKLFLINKKVSGRTENTLRFYRLTLKAFFEEVRKSPLDITSDDIKMYLATKEIRDGISKVYQKNIMRIISSFFQWMQKEEHIMRNPMNKVDNIKTPKVKKEAFTEMQIETLRSNLDDDLRLTCIFEMLLSTWCRVSELVNIKISEISEDMESVLVHGKGEKDRICYINARAKIYLQKYLKERKDSNEYLFTNSNCTMKCSNNYTQKGNHISSECKKAGVKAIDWWKIPDMVGDSHLDKSNVESMIRKLGEKSRSGKNSSA